MGGIVNSWGDSVPVLFLAGERLDRYRQQALSVLADPKTRQAFEVEKADAKTRTLSGGQKRRLDLGVALVGDPELLYAYSVAVRGRRHTWTRMAR